MTYEFLQHYWSFVVALLGALLVSLLFVQGVNAVAHSLDYSDSSRRMIYNSIGSRWAATFVTLIAFCGGFFTAFPLFFFTSFSGAYWLWAIFLATFVLQAISYALQNKVKHAGAFQFFQILNGYIGPMLLGSIMATLFEGANFFVEKSNVIDTANVTSTIHWVNASQGLDFLINPWVLIFSVDIFFLSRILGILFLRRKVNDEEICSNAYGRLIAAAIHFVGLFLIFFVHLLLRDGYSYNEGGFIYMEPGKYLVNFTNMWYLSVILLAGLVLILYGTLRAIIHKTYTGGFWPAGIGTIFFVLALILCAMWNHTAYFPSTEDLQSSLTIANSCNSELVLRTMFYVSLPIPFALAYIIYRWQRS